MHWANVRTTQTRKKILAILKRFDRAANDIEWIRSRSWNVVIGWTPLGAVNKVATCMRRRARHGVRLHTSSFARNRRTPVDHLDRGYVTQRVVRVFCIVLKVRQRNVDSSVSIAVLFTVTSTRNWRVRRRCESVCLMWSSLTKITTGLTKRVKRASKEGEGVIFLVPCRLGSWTVSTRPLLETRNEGLFLVLNLDTSHTCETKTSLYTYQS
jgi:hypothetical protein